MLSDLRQDRRHVAAGADAAALAVFDPEPVPTSAPEGEGPVGAMVIPGGAFSEGG